MKIKSIITVLLIAFILASCAPATTVVPTETTVPTSTVTVVPPTATPIPTIKVEGQNIPDPHFSNPELFDLANSNAPIPQFVNSMKTAEIIVDPQQVANHIMFEQKISIDGKVYIIGYYNLDPIPNKAGETLEGKTPFFISMQDENGKWVWEIASSGKLARLSGRKIGTPIEPGNLSVTKYKNLVVDFSNLLMEDNSNWDKVLKQGVTVEDVVKKIKDAQSSSRELNPSEIFDFSGCDSRARFAHDNNLQVTYLSLLTPGVVPVNIKQDLASGKLSEADFELYLQFYTKSFVERYNGVTNPELKIDNWVIGNEIAGSLMWGDAPTKSLLSKMVNDGILARMYVTAKQANPNSELMLAEDHLLENKTPELRSRFIQVLDILKKQGAPIDAAAIQNHLWLGSPILPPSELESFLKKLEERGLVVNYDEITISQSQKNTFTSESVPTPFQNPDLKQAEWLLSILKPMQSRNGSIMFYSITDVPGPFDTYNSNDLTAKAEMFDTGDSLTFNDTTKTQPRAMYYVLLQFLMK